MNEFLKTGVALGAAAGLAALAYFAKPGEARLDLFDDQGQQFFEGFTNSAAVAELEVTAFRAKTSSVYPFAVKRDENDLWTIPSHSNYPADAADQMGKAAAMLIGLEKQKVVGDEKGRHDDYGVVDPLAEGAQTKGRGKRVTMKDKAGNVLADLIVGNEIEGKPQTFYVRVPGKKRVYTAKLDGKISTQFADWIETDLLKAQAFNIAKITFDNYAVREEGRRRVLVPGDKYVLGKSDDNKWLLEGLDAEKEQTNQTRVGEIATTLSQIKIVGVRSKPEGLTARLERTNSMDAQLLAQQLAGRGYVFANSRLYSNEGDLLFETKSGIRYTLRFGTLVAGSGDELTAGIGSDEPGDKPKEDEPAKPANNRYLMVTAEFVEDLLDKPTLARISMDAVTQRRQARSDIEAIVTALNQYKATNEQKLPASLSVLTEKPAEGEALLAELKQDPWGGDYQLEDNGDTFVVSSHGPDKAAGGEGDNQDVRSDNFAQEDALAKAAGEWTTFDNKVKTGLEEADKLTKRFGPWYYVIDQELFAKLKPARADLVEPKAAEEGGGNKPGAPK